ncbi:MAG TPA: PEP-CTERM sorting domain-containing protein [Bryobacteraceae bacterium]|nr:PEP-CTERM sorting domain-containing protein [Bryobacteraceae bacterium]
MRRLLGTTVWFLIPLLAATFAAQATPIFGPVTFTCAGSYTACVAGYTGGGTSSGSSTVLTTSESDAGWSLGGNTNTLIWYGTGSGSVTSTLPISYNFTIAPYGGGVTFQWELEVVLNSSPNPTSGNGTVVFDSGMSGTSTTSQTINAAGTMNLGSISTLGAWEAELILSFQPTTTGNGVTVTTVGNGIDLDPAPVPEPSTWGMAGGGLLFALTMASRKLRRR